MDDFSLAIGGPSYNFMRRVGLVGEQSPRIGTRAIILALVTWVPLLIISAVEGLALGGVKLPFLKDFTTFARFLVAVPLLVIAEVIIGQRLAMVGGRFITSGLVDEREKPAFRAAVERALKMRDSWLGELIVAAAALAASYYTFSQISIRDISTWYSVPVRGAASITVAGWWYLVVSNLIYEFLLIRWLWRYVIWTLFLWRTARLHLRLVPIHPDNAGGLGFLGIGQTGFGVVILAGSAVLSANMANKIHYAGATIKIVEAPTIVFLIAILIVFLGPLLAFTPKLIILKRRGLLEYGDFAAAYTRSFDSKWVRGDNPESERLLGTPDIQSLADLSNSFQIIKKMRFVPFDIETALLIAIAAVLPALLVLLSAMPVELILKQVAKLLGRIIG